MSRRKLKRFGALLALAGLLVLNLHVLAHVFGQDHDDDGKAGKAAPCALCQTVLAQHSLAAAPSVKAPLNPLGFAAFRTGLAPSRVLLFAVLSSTRGPPASALLV